MEMSDSPVGLRQCHDCGELKPLSDFHANPRRPGGRGSYCKPCFNARAKKSYAKRVADRFGREVRQPVDVPDGHRFCPDCETAKPLTDFPRNRSGRAGYGSYCKPCHNARGRKSKQRLYGGSREYHLRQRYGIGGKEVDELLAEQGGVCAICSAADPEHVDHDHDTGYIRGILCFNCNGGLGQFRDDIDYLTNAIDYLRGTTCRALIHPGVYKVLSPRRGRHPSRSF